MARRELLAAFDGDISERWLRRMAAALEYSFVEEGPVLELERGRFILTPSPNTRKPRRLVPVNGHLPADITEAWAWADEKLGSGSGAAGQVETAPGIDEEIEEPAAAAIPQDDGGDTESQEALAAADRDMIDKDAESWWELELPEAE